MQKNYYLIMILLLTKIFSSNYLNDENIDKIIDLSNKYMSYILESNETSFDLLKDDCKTLFMKNSESDYSDFLFEFFSMDLESFNSIPELQHDVYKNFDSKIKSILEENESELIELDYKPTLEKIRSFYNKFLLRLMIDNIKEKKFKINIKINAVKIFQEYYLSLQSNNKFLRETNENLSKKNKLLSRKKVLITFLGEDSEFSNDLKLLINDISKEIHLRNFYSKLRIGKYFDLNLKIQAIIYKMTRNKNFDLSDFQPNLLKIKELSNLYFKLIKDFDLKTKKNLVFNLSFEKIFVNEFNNEENNLNEIYGYSISHIIQEFHKFMPELSQSMMFEILYTEVAIKNPEIWGSFFSKIYSKSGKQIWTEWENLEENKKNNFSLLMTEFLIYSEINNSPLDQIDQFVKNFFKLVNIPFQMLKTNFVFKLFSNNQCPLKTNFKFNFKLYKAFLDFRFQTFEHLDNENWSSLFDQYLDGRFHYENSEGFDKEFLRYYLNMKVLNLFNMKNDTESKISLLDANIVNSVIENKEKQCENMKNTFIFLAKEFADVQNTKIHYKKSIELLNNLAINPFEFNKKYQSRIIYQLKKESNQKEFVQVENKIDSKILKNNIFEIINGGKLTRKEMDILKRPDILDIFREKQKRDGNLIYQNNDGTNTKFFFIQIVMKQTPCFNALLNKIKKNLVI